MARAHLAFCRSCLISVLALMVTGLTAAAGQDIRTYSKAGSFDDVRADLENAIINRGLKIEYTGNIAGMLDRTGADVGSTQQIYAAAQFLLFCSAKYSRAMMEADPQNLAFCPYVTFVYETAEKPGEIVVGYRRPSIGGTEASKAALSDVEALLDGIVREAVR